MNTLKILTVVGARPQFIKAAVVSRALRESGHTEVLVHSGQHYDQMMSDVFFEELGIAAPAHNLGVGSGPHGMQTGRMLESLEKVMTETEPHAVLVYGDTNSTLAGALSAAKLHLPVAHVEAGIRSFNRRMPEEINRVLTDHVSDVLFAPTQSALDNLAAEGIHSDRVVPTGDVMYDAALDAGARARERPIIQSLGLTPKSFVLATIHRAENTDDIGRMNVIVASLMETARTRPVVWPVHPRTRGVLERHGLLSSEVPSNLMLIDPVGFLDMVALEQAACLIITDSGGVQKEAYFHGVPCVTVRDETEWVELLPIGWNRLAPPTAVGVVSSAVSEALSAVPTSRPMLYGDGKTGQAIVKHLERRYLAAR
jgi:UDP-GlcNAc3NAcA epimerase